VLNGGVGCYIYGLTENIPEGYKLAREVLNSGKATDKSKEWIEYSQAVASS